MGWLREDLRVALRRCRRQPGFTAIVVLTLALGLGANTAVFTLIDTVMLRALPVERPQELYRLGDTTHCCVNSGFEQSWSLFSWALFQHLKQNPPEFSELAAFQATTMQVGVRSGSSNVPQPYTAQFVTANYFRMFGVRAAAGRLFEASDDLPGAPPTVVMSYRAWAREGLDPSVLGRSIVVNGFAFTVVGVAAPDFFGDTVRPDPTGLWVPVGQMQSFSGDRSLLDKDDQHWLYAVGRLKPGTKTKPIDARLTAALQQWLGAQPWVPADARPRLQRQRLVLTPAGSGVPVLGSQFSQPLSLMFLTSAVLLLIACANLANLLLARADRGQAAIRAALGASAPRLLRQSVVEGLLLAVAGGVAGVAVAGAGTGMLIALAFPGGVYIPVSASPSASVLMFAFALALITGILFTAAPAWAMSRTAPLDALAGVGRSGHQQSFIPRRSLVITQVALSFALITSAGLLFSSLSNLENQKLGFEPDNRIVIRMDAPVDVLNSAGQLASMFERLRQRLNRVAGVVEASYSLSGPMDGNNWQSGVAIAGRRSDPDRPNSSSWNRVGPAFFSTVGSTIVRGRTIGDTDTAGSHRVAVVNETFVRRYFENTDPIGKTVGIGGEAHGGDFEIVGVAEDVKYAFATQDVRPMLFLPAFQSGDYSGEDSTRNVMLRSMAMRSVIVHTRGDAGNFGGALRAAVAEVNADINIVRILPLSLQVSGNFRIQRLLSRLTSLYAGLALVLTALGLYGVTSYAVSRRTREIGVRMALGADCARVMRTVIAGPVLETVIGLAIGLPLAMLAGRALGSQLYGLGAQNPVVWAITIGILVTTSILAAAIPSRRAATIDPARALRGD
jgi:predicted permease